MNSIWFGRRKLNLTLLIILISLIILPSVIPSNSNAVDETPVDSHQSAAWLSGWEYRKSHEIIGSTGAGINYQIRLHVEYGSGTDSGDTVYLNSHTRSDFGDVRFTDDDGTTKLDYWIEKYTPGDDAIFWVEVGDSLGVDQTIYIYYGNDGEVTTSSGVATFLFFDDFEGALDTTKWETVQGSIFTGDGYLELEGTSETRGGIETKQSYAFSYDTACQISGYASEPAIQNMHIHTMRKYQDENNKFTNYGAENSNRIKTVAKAGTGLSYDTNTVNDLTSIHTYTIHRDQSWMSWCQDGEEVVRISSDISTADFGVAFSEGTDPSDVFYVDYVFVRNWIHTEPSHGGWGNEVMVGDETSTTVTTTTETTIYTEDAALDLPLLLTILVPAISVVVVIGAVAWQKRTDIGSPTVTSRSSPSPSPSKSKREPPNNPQDRKDLILGALKSYPRIGLEELSEITGIDKMEIRDTILTLIANDRVSGTFDRSTDEFVSADATRTGQEIRSQTQGPRGLPRCPYCGAPLEKTLGVGETGTCSSCGRKLMG